MREDLAVAAIVGTDGDFQVCRRTIEYLARQTIRDRVELIIVCPSEEGLAPDLDVLSKFGKSTIVEVGTTLSTGQVLAAGVGASAAPYVMYFEEHNFPPPETLEKAMAVMEGTDRIALGFAMTPANPGSVAYAHLYLQFGQVAEPVRSGEVDRLGGHHALYRKDAILGYGDALPDLMSNEAILHEDLRQKRIKMYVLGDVAIPHVKVSGIRSLMQLEFVAQRIYGHTRANFLAWSPFRRATYIVGAPLIPILRMSRVYRDVRRTGRGMGFFLRIAPAVTLAALAGAVGEAMGYAIGTSMKDQSVRLNMELDRYAFVNHIDQVGPRAPRQ